MVAKLVNASLCVACCGALLSALAFVVAPSAHAQGDLDPATVERLRAVPGVFWNDLRRGISVESFVAKQLNVLQSADRNGDGLTQQDIDTATRSGEAAQRAEQFARYLRFDFDGDFRVTRDELIAGSEDVGRALSPAQRQQFLANFLSADEDGDNVITLEEIRRLPLPIPSSVGEPKPPQRLLALDPNKDARLTADEVRSLARAAFAAVDTNDDGEIGETEAQLFIKVTRAKQGELPCVLPKVDAGEQVVLYSALGGSAVSTVAIGGPDREVSVTLVEIEDGQQPIYLVLSSMKPIVWKIEGSIERVTHVVVVGPAAPARKVGAGVVGVPKERVFFVRSQDCFRAFVQADSDHADAARGVLAAAAGRRPSAVFAFYEAPLISLPSGVVRKVTSASPPPGFDQIMWANFIRSRPAGVSTIDPTDVVSDEPVELFEVLPLQAGLAQLLGSGALKRVGGSDRDLRIERPIARFPAGLHDLPGLRFVLSPGVPMPPGDPGRSCIFIEATGQKVGQRPCD